LYLSSADPDSALNLDAWTGYKGFPMTLFGYSRVIRCRR
jgi:hypothetical protein